MTGDARLAEIRERLERSTPGPWEWCPNPNGSLHCGEFRASSPYNGFLLVAALTNWNDGDLMASAPEDIRWLLDQLENRAGEKLPAGTVCACLGETGERKVRVYEECQRCHALMEFDLPDELRFLEANLGEALSELDSLRRERDQLAARIRLEDAMMHDGIAALEALHSAPRKDKRWISPGLQESIAEAVASFREALRASEGTR